MHKPWSTTYIILWSSIKINIDDNIFVVYKPTTDYLSNLALSSGKTSKVSKFLLKEELFTTLKEFDTISKHLALVWLATSICVSDNPTTFLNLRTLDSSWLIAQPRTPQRYTFFHHSTLLITCFPNLASKCHCKFLPPPLELELDRVSIKSPLRPPFHPTKHLYTWLIKYFPLNFHVGQVCSNIYKKFARNKC